jgi:hypothetical protein
MWVQHVACLTVVEQEKKYQIHDQNGSEPNRCMSFMDIRGGQNASRVSSLAGEVACPLRLGGLKPWRRTTVPRWWVISHILFWLFFNVFFKVVRWRLHLKLRIRFSPPYPCFGDVYSVAVGV